MPLTVTVVHTPNAVSSEEWRTLHRAAGRLPHELRLTVHGILHPTGRQLQNALESWLKGHLSDDEPEGSTDEGSTEQSRLSTTVGGIPLAALSADSPQIHSGMVVLLRTASSSSRHRTTTRPARSGLSTLRICIDGGPDAGRILPLRRGSCTVGRAGEVAVADPSMGRIQCRLTVDDRGVSLKEQGKEQPWTSDEPLMLGNTTLQLLNGPSPSGPGGRWPVQAEHVTEKPPEGKHRMTLVMALVPLLVGIVLVTMTGMWFFLLFSAVSALVATGTVIDAVRRRRLYHRALQQAAEMWGQRRDAALPTPGRLAQMLREGVGPRLAAETVRLGTGQLTAELKASASETPPATGVLSAAALALTPGEQTVLRGHRREVERLLRWVLLQLLLRPAENRAPVLLLKDRHFTVPPEVRDISHFTVLQNRDLRNRNHPETAAGTSAGVLVILEEERADRSLLDRSYGREQHVIVCSYAPAQAAQRHPGQTVDLFEQTLIRNVEDSPDTEVTDLQPDGLSSQTFAELLRLALPHSAGSGESSRIPRQYEAPLPEPLMSQSAQRSLTTELGRGTDDVELLDLVNDGPHILLAGTSGSGKSELLKSLMLGWAAAYGPEEVNFILFDFKGGATFQKINQLEHSLGLVTDLVQAQAERTLESIHSELKRRERLFLETGAGDYAEYRRLEPDRALARILVVIDEFRIFSHELPDTMDELMRLATLGRSLGLHLVLATQRPQGVVTADIRANIGSIVTLRLRSEGESEHLVGTKEAGRIPRDLPGRGIIRRPGEEPRPFQSARLTSGTETLTATPESEYVPGEAEAEWSDTSSQIVRRMASAAPGRQRVHTPLLPPLPEEIPCSPPNTSPAVGLVDDPARQDQWELPFLPADPQSLAFIGEGSSGGVQGLAALTSQLLTSPEEAHLYLLDGDRSLERFRHHPRVGSWVTEEHMPELEHLLSVLKDELTARRIGRGTSSVPLILVMSGHSQWHMAAQSAGPGVMDHVLGTLISEGAGVGISAVLSGGRELVSGRLGARVPNRIYLPYGVSEDTSFMWPKLRPVDTRPGRGVLVTPKHPAPGLEIQLLTAAPDEALDDRFSTEEPGSSMLRVHPLPETLSYEDLAVLADEQDPAAEIGPVVGVAQFTHAPVPMGLGPVNLILGARGTGKSSCLEVLRRQLGARSQDWEQEPEGDADLPEILLIDDADRLKPEDHQRLERLLQQGVRIVATAAPGTGVFTALPWAHRARGGPGNMLLSPTHRSQADAFAVSVPVLERPIPGRAVRLRPEAPMMLQWASPTSASLSTHSAHSQ